ncbi:MAG: hypothetical protein V4536_08590 [Pseudomonadota bacterium]
MSTLAQLQINLYESAKRIGDLISPAGNMNKPELFNTACKAHAITSQICIEIDRLIIPSFLDLPATGERAEELKQLTDKRWEEGL